MMLVISGSRNMATRHKQRTIYATPRESVQQMQNSTFSFKTGRKVEEKWTIYSSFPLLATPKLEKWNKQFHFCSTSLPVLKKKSGILHLLDSPFSDTYMALSLPEHMSHWKRVT